MLLDFQAYCVYLENRFLQSEAKWVTLSELFLTFNFPTFNWKFVQHS